MTAPVLFVLNIQVFCGINGKSLTFHADALLLIWYRMI